MKIGLYKWGWEVPQPYDVKDAKVTFAEVRVGDEGSSFHEVDTAPRKLRQDVPSPPPPPPPPRRSDCAWTVNRGQWGGDIGSARVSSKEQCCALCWANPACHAADLASPNSTGAGICHLKAENSPATRNDGSVSCVPKPPPATPSTLARPTLEQLAWQDLELGVHIPLTMGECATTFLLGFCVHSSNLGFWACILPRAIATGTESCRTTTRAATSPFRCPARACSGRSV